MHDVPMLGKCEAVYCFILNIFSPGLGTIMAGLYVSIENCEGMPKCHILVAFLQILLSFGLIGWFWSWYWGYLLLVKAFK